MLGFSAQRASEWLYTHDSTLATIMNLLRHSKPPTFFQEEKWYLYDETHPRLSYLMISGKEACQLMQYNPESKEIPTRTTPPAQKRANNAQTAMQISFHIANWYARFADVKRTRGLDVGRFCVGRRRVHSGDDCHGHMGASPCPIDAVCIKGFSGRHR